MHHDDRSELKFLLPAHQYEGLFSALAPALQPDPHASADGFYPVTTLYYDCPALSCYWDASHGMPNRRKLRIRTYGTLERTGAASSFLEMKYKADGRGAKKRVQTPLNNALQIAAGSGTLDDFSPADLQTVEAVHALALGECYRPTCLIRYHRHAYALHLDGGQTGAPLRVTFDHELRAGFDKLHAPLSDCPTPNGLLPEGYRIMEVKCSGSLPLFFSQKLTEYHLQPKRFSKYRVAMELRLGNAPNRNAVKGN